MTTETDRSSQDLCRLGLRSRCATQCSSARSERLHGTGLAFFLKHFGSPAVIPAGGRANSKEQLLIVRSLVVPIRACTYYWPISHPVQWSGLPTEPSLARSEVLHGTDLASFFSYLTWLDQFLTKFFSIIDGIAGSDRRAKAVPSPS